MGTALLSGVIAALVAAVVTLYKSGKAISIENITQERQKWRDKIRELAQKIVAAYRGHNTEELLSLHVEMHLLLNPMDKDDKSILCTIREMIEQPGTDDLHLELAEKLSLLLKHDWERAKQEVRPFWRKPFWTHPLWTEPFWTDPSWKTMSFWKRHLLCKFHRLRRISHDEFKPPKRNG